VIAQTKTALNTLTEEQTKAAAAMGEWKERIEKLTTAEELTGIVEPIQAADPSVRENVKRLLVKIAKEKGFVFDKEKGFIAPAPAAEAPATATKKGKAAA
jgi:hypothetical protein